VVPEELRVQFDLRVTPKEEKQVEMMLEEWCAECDVTIDYTHVSVCCRYNVSVCCRCNVSI